MADLHLTQRWLLEVVAHPDGVAAGAQAAAETLGAADAVVAQGPRLSPLEQLHIYGFMYFERQVEVLENELPTTRFLLGPDAFRAEARHFLTEHPSRHPNLDRLGARFPDYLASSPRPLPHRGLAVSLARVERAMDDLLDAPYDALMAPGSFADVPPSDWADLRLTPIRALRLLELSHPVRPFMDAHRDRRYLAAPAPAPAWAAVFRGRDDVVWRAEWPRERFELLRHLQAGLTLGDALQAVATAPWANVGLLGAQLQRWFSDWIDDGLLCAPA